jgi:hypothetical protein
MEDIDNGVIVKENIFNYSPHGLVYVSSGQLLPEDGAIFKLSPTAVPCQQIDQLWNQYADLVGNEVPLSLTMELVSLLKSLFGCDFKQWLYLQVVNNRKVTKEMLAYLRDTLVFVSGGCRSVAPASWRVLLDNTEVSSASAENKIAIFGDVNIPNTIDLLADWVKQPNGIDDLFQAAKILFGSK